MCFNVKDNNNCAIYIITNTENIVLPKEIGGFLDLRGLTSAEGLVLPESYINTVVYTAANISYIPDEEYFNRENKSVKK